MPIDKVLAVVMAGVLVQGCTSSKGAPEVHRCEQPAGLDPDWVVSQLTEVRVQREELIDEDLETSPDPAIDDIDRVHFRRFPDGTTARMEWRRGQPHGHWIISGPQGNRIVDMTFVSGELRSVSTSE
jgi:hypothetical protein